MEKVSLYKFTHTPLLKNDGQLIQKSDQKKKQSPNLLKNKVKVPKKITWEDRKWWEDGKVKG